MSTTAKTYTKGQMTVEIYYDQDAQNPRQEYDHLGTLCLSDSFSHLRDTDEPPSDGDIVLPVYCYQHGGIAFNTTGFSCNFDSGQVGVIYISRDKIKEEYGSVDDDTIKQAKRLMVGEIQELSQYADGEVYGFSVYQVEGEVLDGCGGFYGFEWCKEEADSIAQHYEYERLARIKSHIPFLKH